MSVVGARPQFVKLAPISKTFSSLEVDHIIVHTGQHYDPLLSDVFFEDLQIPAPNVHLGVGSGSHGVQTGKILSELDSILEKFSPDCVLVYGDTNSTLAAAICASKLHFKVAHLEAGLRSFNRRMPEEINRVLTDHASDLCLAPTTLAMNNLKNEGLLDISLLVGDVMTDVLYQTKDLVLSGKITNPFNNMGEGQYYIATIHRAETTDNPKKLLEIISALSKAEMPVKLLAHPRLIEKARQHGINLNQGKIDVCKPLPYPVLVAALMGSRAVLTDSGGLQKEAFLLRIPCITFRDETEWVETVNLGWNFLANSEHEILRVLNSRAQPESTSEHPYGNGYASIAVANAIISNFG